MILRLINILLFLYTLSLGVNAESINIKVGYARIALIDLGSLIIADPILSDITKFKLYTLSALEDESHKNIIAIQGLKSSGEGDLSVKTNSGFYQFHLMLAEESTDYILNQQNSKIITLENILLQPNRSSIIRSKYPINEYILAGNPNLVTASQLVNYYDDDFLKVFLLNTKSYEGSTDIVIPTNNMLYKLPIKISNKYDHENTVNLN